MILVDVVPAIQLEPYTMLAHRNDSSKLRQNAMYEGYIVDLLEQLALLVNFRYRLVPVWDGEYGAWKNRKWDGMIGEVVRRVSCARAKRRGLAQLPILASHAGVAMIRPFRVVHICALPTITLSFNLCMFC